MNGSSLYSAEVASIAIFALGSATSKNVEGCVGAFPWLQVKYFVHVLTVETLDKKNKHSRDEDTRKFDSFDFGKIASRRQCSSHTGTLDDVRPAQLHLLTYL